MTDPHQLSRRNVLQLVGISAVGVAGVGAAAGCAPAEPSGNSSAGSESGGEFHGAYPYQEPPEGNFNGAGITGGILIGSIYNELWHLPSAMYHWAEQTWENYLIDSYELDEGTKTFTLKIKDGLKWSDGETLTAKDYVTTWHTRWILSSPLWNYISKVEAVDDLTFTATMNAPSTAAERYLLRERILPTSQYGEFAERAGKLIAAGKTTEDDESLLDDLNNFKPDAFVASGPYNVDPDSVTSTELTLVKNDTGHFADQVKFDTIKVYNGETTEISPLVQSKDIDYATHGFAVAAEKSFENVGFRIIRPPVYSGPGLVTNFANLKHFKDIRVRQAIAMAVDRAQNGKVSLGDSGVAVKYMAGLADKTCETWLEPDGLAKLNTYDLDQDGAAKLLEEAGWKRENKKWRMPDGKPVEFEVKFPQTYADWSGAATDIVEQLNGFGFDLAPRGVDDAQAGVDLAKGRFQLQINAWGSSTHTHPYFSYVQDFLQLNYPITKNQGGRGMDYDLNPDTELFGKVDIQKLLTESGTGLDMEDRRASLTKIAQIFNEQLPIVPLFERFGNNPALEGERVKGFPADDDPIVQNAPYADNFVIMKILDGSITPA